MTDAKDKPTASMSDTISANTQGLVMFRQRAHEILNARFGATQDAMQKVKAFAAHKMTCDVCKATRPAMLGVFHDGPLCKEGKKLYGALTAAVTILGAIISDPVYGFAIDYLRQEAETGGAANMPH